MSRPSDGRGSVRPVSSPAATTVVGLDGSDVGFAALRWAADLARRLDARLVVVHATGLLEGAGVAPALDAAELLARAGVEDGAETVVEPGPAPDVLIRVCERVGGDLIVVGHRGLGASERALGSTSEAVLAAAGVPVVVVPGPR